jgi:hypothetical protein
MKHMALASISAATAIVRKARTPLSSAGRHVVRHDHTHLPWSHPEATAAPQQCETTLPPCPATDADAPIGARAYRS